MILYGDIAEIAFIGIYIQEIGISTGSYKLMLFPVAFIFIQADAYNLNFFAVVFLQNQADFSKQFFTERAIRFPEKNERMLRLEIIKTGIAEIMIFHKVSRTVHL